MRFLREFMVVPLLLTAAACTSKAHDISKPSDTPLPPIVVHCAKFEATAKKISDAQGALYGTVKGDAHQAVETLATELTALESGAPSDVKSALADMISAFRNAEELLKNPTADNKKTASDLAKKLSADGQKITKYFTTHCGS